VASPFSWMLIFVNDRGGREMYCERALRALSECDPIRTEQLKEKPECFQLMRLVARLALMSFFFKKNLMITRRKYSDILLRFPRGICTNLPASSKPPSTTMACQCGLKHSQPKYHKFKNHGLLPFSSVAWSESRSDEHTED